MNKPLKTGQTIYFACHYRKRASAYSKGIISGICQIKNKVFVDYIYRVVNLGGKYRYIDHSPSQNRPFSGSFLTSTLKRFLVPDEAALKAAFEKDQGQSFSSVPKRRKAGSKNTEIDGLPAITRKDSLDTIIAKIQSTHHQTYNSYGLAIALRERAPMRSMKNRLQKAVDYFARQQMEAV